MSSNLGLSFLLNLPTHCATLPPIPYNPPGILALGPTHAERDILYNCCHVLTTNSYSSNDTVCLQTAVCTVQECGLRDPTFACVARMREVWGVQGVLGCGVGVESGAMSLKDRLGWMVVVGTLVTVVLGICGV
ncbi:hypothetical protein T440DRAFT_277130 [Plenodomus tracheiphilus IPT5]|uniref:Extracellular membrane protein CFEM domain-containing protein n=1 Tax=Plenodomus tracheiphilus IPT5 TaxID=1408161 RepID=A0A6A7AST5_9PLEO|nr:hypothetical protein T440DRAFT_277130 [Plenodomus tracheiphilus IPT5]